MPPRIFDYRRLRHVVTLQSAGAPTPDGQGGTTSPWTDVGTYWAEVMPLSGRELFNAQQTKAETTHRITLRDVAPIDPTQRFVVPATGQVFNISEVLFYNEQVPYYSILAAEQYGETQ